MLFPLQTIVHLIAGCHDDIQIDTDTLCAQQSVWFSVKPEKKKPKKLNLLPLRLQRRSPEPDLILRNTTSAAEERRLHPA